MVTLVHQSQFLPSCIHVTLYLLTGPLHYLSLGEGTGFQGMFQASPHNPTDNPDLTSLASK